MIESPGNIPDPSDAPPSTIPDTIVIPTPSLRPPANSSNSKPSPMLGLRGNATFTVSVMIVSLVRACKYIPSGIIADDDMAIALHSPLIDSKSSKLYTFISIASSETEAPPLIILADCCIDDACITAISNLVVDRMDGRSLPGVMSWSAPEYGKMSMAAQITFIIIIINNPDPLN